tara:strand:+ start:1439 stop:1660 length:222 start_codon:yes stop_codon:yes gene_type:complete
MKVNNEILNDSETVVECTTCGEYWIVTDKTLGHNIAADGSHCRQCYGYEVLQSTGELWQSVPAGALWSSELAL